MSFERPTFQNPERALERKEEEEVRAKKVRSLIEGIAERLAEEGIPVTEDCRIDTSAFLGVYSQETIQKDEEEVKKAERKWYKGASPEEIKKKKEMETGEQFEKLKTVVFDNSLGGDFLVVRASSYDDIKNGVDNVILERKTGNLVCAFDEVGETSGEAYERKRQKITERNEMENGGRLKYGIGTTEEGNLILTEVKNLPIFYLALPKEFIKKGIDNLSDKGEQGEFEKKLFLNVFCASLERQLKELLGKRKLNPQLKKRALRFREVLDKIKRQREENN